MKAYLRRKVRTAQQYPYLGKSRVSGAVVFFSSRGAGTVVVAGGKNVLGECSIIWDEEDFDPTVRGDEVVLAND